MSPTTMPLEFPPIYLLKAYIERDPQELRRLEKEIRPVWNTREAKIFLGKLQSNRRAEFELCKLGLNVKEVQGLKDARQAKTESQSDSRSTPRKRRKIDNALDVNGKEIITLDSDTESDNDESGLDQVPRLSSSKQDDLSQFSKVKVSEDTLPATRSPGGRNLISVLHLTWYMDSIKASKILPYEDYLIYQGEIQSTSEDRSDQRFPKGNVILARAQEDAPSSSRRNFGKYAKSRGQASSQPPLLHETTTEHDNMPPVPKGLEAKYSCQRSTPLHCPNEAFLAQLRILKQARLLEHEEMHARAYQSAIATIAAYPHNLMSAGEISRLPSCGGKITGLWQEWHDTGHISEVDGIEADPRMQSLNIFYGIHDVGHGNAKKFYDRGWRDLDDVIEHGWDTLTRNQRIGVKYYDEFQQRIPRSEVEKTAEIILDHASRIQAGFQMVICGGYRRGKPDCGDVDVILSHPDEVATDGFLETLLESLEERLWITHRLTMSTRNSDRGQSPVSWRGGMQKAGSGFDTLDHAFVVWQDQDWASREEDTKKDPNFTNPNPHRRVDIIVSPWKTAGCAVLAWSGGTMFERDLRHYCKYVLNLKFDSSGVRRRDGGAWVDLESGDGDLLEKEKRVFSGLKLEWIEPTERCTD